MCLGTHDEFCIVIDVMRPMGGKLKVEDRHNKGTGHDNETETATTTTTSTPTLATYVTTPVVRDGIKDDKNVDEENERETHNNDKDVHVPVDTHDAGPLRTTSNTRSTFFRGVVRNTFLDFNAEDRGRTMMRSPHHGRATTWHPCKCSRYPRAAGHEHLQWQETECWHQKIHADSAPGTPGASTPLLDALHCRTLEPRVLKNAPRTDMDESVVSSMPLVRSTCHASGAAHTDNAGVCDPCTSRAVVHVEKPKEAAMDRSSAATTSGTEPFRIQSDPAFNTDPECDIAAQKLSERPYASISSASLEDKYLAYANNLVSEGQGLNGPYRTVSVTLGESTEDVDILGGLKKQMAEVFKDKPVTMMLRNYPRERSQECLLSELKASVLHDSFDFLYLPTCVQTKSNKGYAFINFKSTAMAEKFYTLWHKTWFPTRMRRPMTVAPAAVQGLIANVRRICDECNFKRITNTKYHPIIFDETGNRLDLHDLIDRKLTSAHRGKTTPVENRRKKTRGSAPRDSSSMDVHTYFTM